jgi:AcrR family transcriptional regulator
MNSADRDALLAQLFTSNPSKGERRTLDIVEGAIRCYATLGIEKTTFATIAKAAKASRPLVQHYFEDKEAIFDLAVKYIRLHLQTWLTTELGKQKTPSRLLETYIDIHFEWLAQYPHHTRVWLLFYFQCTTDKKAKQLNTELAAVGRERIAAMLRAGGYKAANITETAREIQTLITGALIVGGTESVDIQAYTGLVKARCLALAKQA